MITKVNNEFNATLKALLGELVDTTDELAVGVVMRRVLNLTLYVMEKVAFDLTYKVSEIVGPYRTNSLWLHLSRPSLWELVCISILRFLALALLLLHHVLV